MTAFVKFDQFANDLVNKVHDLLGTSGSTADVLKIMLTNSAPAPTTNAVKADITEITAANGYVAGGAGATNVGTKSGGSITVAGTNVVFTAAGGAVGPFRYAVLYNDTPTSPAKPLIGYWDYGSAVTLADAETFTVQFGASIFTVA